MRIAIVDDEPDAREYLKRVIKQWTEAEVACEAHSIESAVELLKTTQVDVALLDIELPDGLSFEILNKISNPQFRVIFITAYDHYALKAFDYAAVGYLLKPVKPEILIKHLHRVAEQTNRVSREQLDVLVNQLVKKKAPEKISLSADDAVYFVNLQQIVRCEAYDNYTTIVFQTQDQKFRKITISKTIKFYEDLLPDEQFMRIHKSNIVNFRMISRFVKSDGGYVVMADGAKVIISRRRKKEFLERLDF